MIAYHPQRKIVFDPDQDLIKKPAQKADYRQKSLNHVGDSSVYCPAEAHFMTSAAPERESIPIN